MGVLLINTVLLIVMIIVAIVLCVIGVIVGLKFAEEQGKTVTGSAKVDFLCNKMHTERKLLRPNSAVPKKKPSLL